MNATPTPVRNEQHALLRALPVGPDTDYSIEEIAALANMGISTLYRLIALEQGPRVMKRGRRSIVTGSDYLGWRAARGG